MSVMCVRTGLDVGHRAVSTCSLWKMTNRSAVNRRRLYSTAARTSAVDSREMRNFGAGDITMIGSTPLDHAHSEMTFGPHRIVETTTGSTLLSHTHSVIIPLSHTQSEMAFDLCRTAETCFCGAVWPMAGLTGHHPLMAMMIFLTRIPWQPLLNHSMNLNKKLITMLLTLS